MYPCFYMEKNKKLIVGWPLGKRIKNKIKGINEKVERGETCFVRWRKEWISKVGGGRAGGCIKCTIYTPIYIFYYVSGVPVSPSAKPEENRSRSNR